MFKFRRFKTNFNLYNGRKKILGEEYVNTISINGAYRTNRDEFIHSSNPNPQRNSTPVPIPPPPLRAPPEPPRRLRATKSTSDLIRDKNLPPNLRPAQSGISLDPRGADNETRNSIDTVEPKSKRQLDAEKRVDKQRAIEQKKAEKQRIVEERKLEKQRLQEEKKRAEEQKKRDKLASIEQAKQEKLRKEREKKEAQQLKTQKKVKRAAPQRPLANPLAQAATQSLGNPLAQGSGTQNSTNTLDSSISKSSGPPPYSQVLSEMTENENNSNVSFGKPIDSGSWDMVSQHRNNVINRPMNTAGSAKVETIDLKKIDLNFNVGEESRSNTDV